MALHATTLCNIYIQNNTKRWRWTNPGALMTSTDALSKTLSVASDSASEYSNSCCCWSLSLVASTLYGRRTCHMCNPTQPSPHELPTRCNWYCNTTLCIKCDWRHVQIRYPVYLFISSDQDNLISYGYTLNCMRSFFLFMVNTNHVSNYHPRWWWRETIVLYGNVLLPALPCSTAMKSSSWCCHRFTSYEKSDRDGMGRRNA